MLKIKMSAGALINFKMTCTYSFIVVFIIY